MPLRSFYPQSAGDYDAGSYSSDQVAKHTGGSTRQANAERAKVRAEQAAEQSRRHPN